MAWKNRDSIIQGEQFMPDARKEQVSVSSWEIPAPNSFAEEDIATNDNLLIKNMKAQASGAVAGDKVKAHGDAEQIDRSVLLEEEVCRERLDLQSETPLAEEVGVADHRRGVGMKGSFAAMALDYRGSIDDMIKVSMGEQKEIDLFVRESGIGALRSVEKDAAQRRPVVKAISVEDTAGEAFEPIHEKMVRDVMSRFDFRESVCKVLAFIR